MLETVDGLARDRRGCRTTDRDSRGCRHRARRRPAACATDGQVGRHLAHRGQALVALGSRAGDWPRRWRRPVRRSETRPKPLERAIGGGQFVRRPAESLKGPARRLGSSSASAASRVSMIRHHGRIPVSQQLPKCRQKLPFLCWNRACLCSPQSDSGSWSRQFRHQPDPLALTAMATAQPALPLNLAAFNRMNATQKLAVLAAHRAGHRAAGRRAALGEGTDLRRGVRQPLGKGWRPNRRRARAAERSLPNRGRRSIPVPSHQVHDVRLRLASQGLPKGGLVGFEVMETQKLGISHPPNRSTTSARSKASWRVRSSRSPPSRAPGSIWPFPSRPPSCATTRSPPLPCW